MNILTLLNSVFAWEVGNLIPISLGLFLFDLLLVYLLRWIESWRPDDVGGWVMLWVTLIAGDFMIFIAGPIIPIIITVVAMSFIVWRGAFVIDYIVGIIGSKLISRDETGELWSYPNPQETIYRVIVEDKEGKHALRVPPTMRTAKQAVAWTYRMNGDEYNPDVRT